MHSRLRSWALLTSMLLTGCLVQPPPGVDCSDLPETLGFDLLVGPQAYKGLLFDDSGGVLGSDELSLVRSEYDQSPEVVLPGLGEVTQFDRLPGGDIVTNQVETGDLLRITPNGGLTVLVPNLRAYAVRVGPDGNIYTAGIDGIFRVDPETAERTTVIRGDPQGGTGPRVLSFERSGTRLYWGSDEAAQGGRIQYVEIDADVQPTSEAQVLATGVGGGFHDAMGVDACGNVYVLDWWWSALIRVTPRGDIAVLLDVAEQDDGPLHGLRWGSGVGGWKSDRLYAPRPATHEVYEIDVGLPAWHWDPADGD